MISIIGPGKVGTAVGVLAARAGYRVIIGGRRKSRARAAARLIGRGAVAMACDEAAAVGRIVLLTVSDSAIGPLCAELAATRTFASDAIVAHCCGALASDVLRPAMELCGCAIASMHPLQTFPTARAAVDAMPGTYFFIEGDKAAIGPLAKLARAIGGRPCRIGGSPRAKALYHAAGCMASNYLVALMDAVLAVAKEAGIEAKAAWPAFRPLVEATLRNIAALGPAGALTGPIARGDAQTVARHVAAIASCPGARKKGLDRVYRAMGQSAVGLALRKGTIGPRVARELETILKTEGEH
jgi:predicted short-subunit dehydrogenase-like oxidoreductase (DUF2520 family)